MLEDVLFCHGDELQVEDIMSLILKHAEQNSEGVALLRISGSRFSPSRFYNYVTC